MRSTDQELTIQFLEKNVKLKTANNLRNNESIFRVRLSTLTIHAQLEHKIDATREASSELSTCMENLDVKTSINTKNVSDLGFKVDEMYQDILGNITSTGKEINTLDKYKNELKVSLTKLTKDIKEFTDQATKPTIGETQRRNKKAMKTINEGTLDNFEKLVRRIPPNVDFNDAWDTYPLEDFFYPTDESRTGIEMTFLKIRRTTKPSMMKIAKEDDPGKFFISFTIKDLTSKMQYLIQNLV
ncbi:unnamed protein product [Arabis nemorensis]|uniref:Uncharacterized protein n=1 Tax=Arabis nemorensis TaxID=586526 RepID=A0A565AZ04_9BRAS|nr:unnamed protein product [Arabis nemorensis]